MTIMKISIKYIVYLIILFIIFIGINTFSSHLGKIDDDLNNIYYFFSTSAQVIGAFIALILAGYVFVHQMMDARQDKDDSLTEIHKKLKYNYFVGLRYLAVMTCFSIILDLLILEINGFNKSYPWHNFFVKLFPYYKSDLMIITAVLNFLTILGATILVIYIINPKTYENAISSLIEESNKKYTQDETVDEKEFFFNFVQLEREVRSFINKNKNIYIKSKYNYNRGMYSFREMITGLLHTGVISGDFYEELLEINKYRNLLFHGNVEKVNVGMVEAVKTAYAQMKNILENYSENY